MTISPEKRHEPAYARQHVDEHTPSAGTTAFGFCKRTAAVGVGGRVLDAVLAAGPPAERLGPSRACVCTASLLLIQGESRAGFESGIPRSAYAEELGASTGGGECR